MVEKMLDNKMLDNKMLDNVMLEQCMNLSCPCGSGQLLSGCCALLHAGQNAQSAEQLMRSRYSAYVLGKIDYIVKTTVPAQQALLDVAAITAWSEQNQWQGLTIHRVQAKANARHAQVEFTAHFNNQQGAQTHRELSTFVRIGQQWYFLDPTLDQALEKYPALKAACLCGSGQKFKRCCAPFLAII